ncbi:MULTISPECIES: TRAP transporter large permease subunit [Thauera]|jgi:C4-dicarboxylate transporter DctM subunit|uniref:TRAP transporter large permease protein n=2 Tax=Thauera aminoaromatica TaxID=164330 RepID=C4ZLB4_THASP|nr:MULTISPECIES: TRAP transporter large permease subunit [Thauera]MDA0235756.1 TRAP transporter large permease subunit [Pseudomonadota bacterium]ACK53298.1 TRAP dicarboxylate transporter, DctM subunit [Thauera aminoaromatica]ENO85085.1 TRAP dicarboxylate transporter subunit DctM [Thauera aminoaromatica S2]KIN91498.1 TRAP transporter, DctM subunit [Thauera sp. SWB20]MBL8461357.1 TRAP transporter large permease subunit [Thauera sp.]
MEVMIAAVLIGLMLALLAGGVWIGLALMAIGILGMLGFTPRAPGDGMAVAIWSHGSSWTLTALPLFLWMGEILFRTKLSEDMFKGLSPWLERLPGRLLHTNIIGCTLFAAVSGSSAATCATIGKIALPELQRRGYPESMALGTLAGAGTLGLLIPPSIIMIVYGVAADVSISKLFIGGVLPGILLASLFMGWVVVWSLMNPGKIPAADLKTDFMGKLRASKNLIPVILLIGGVLGSIYSGIATATEAAAIGVIGSLIIAASQRTLNRKSFFGALMGATRLYCMIALILAGSAFLTLAMGYIGLPRHLAEWIGGLGLTPGMLLVALAIFYILLGCFLDGISIVVLTMAVLMPTIQAAGIDPLWFGIFVVVVVEMAQVTPPVGFNLFVLQGLTGRDMTVIARYALPYFLLMVLAVVLLYTFPGLVTWLPGHMIG